MSGLKENVNYKLLFARFFSTPSIHFTNEVQFTLKQTMEAQRESRGTALLVL